MSITKLHVDLPTVESSAALKIVTDAIASRELEVFLYRLNIANYTAMQEAGAFTEQEPGELANRIAAEKAQLARSMAALDALRYLVPLEPARA